MPLDIRHRSLGKTQRGLTKRTDRPRRSQTAQSKQKNRQLLTCRSHNDQVDGARFSRGYRFGVFRLFRPSFFAILSLFSRSQLSKPALVHLHHGSSSTSSAEHQQRDPRRSGQRGSATLHHPALLPGRLKSLRERRPRSFEPLRKYLRGIPAAKDQGHGGRDPPLVPWKPQRGPPTLGQD